VQLLGLRHESLGLLAQPQRREVLGVQVVEVLTECALGAAQRLADRPARVAGDLRAREALVGDGVDDRGGIAGDTAAIASRLSIALSGIAPVPTSCCQTSGSLRMFARAVTFAWLQPSAWAAPSGV
jgi:hypothetical protein